MERYKRSSKVGYGRKPRRSITRDRSALGWTEQKTRPYEPNLLSPAVTLKQVAFYDGYQRDRQWDWYFKTR